MIYNILSRGIFKMATTQKCRKSKNRNFHISTFKCQRCTKFIFRYMFLRMTNTIKLVKYGLLITKDLKIQDGHQFWAKVVHDMKSTNMSLVILPSPDLNLTPLPAFFTFLPSLAALGKKRKKAARGVRFKSGLWYCPNFAYTNSLEVLYVYS